MRASQYGGALFAILFNFHVLRILPVRSTSINYGISQRPITDISQLMPTLCQNQSVICEGSFCIPGVRKCVCDLRQPVQFGRFCLRQVDIETKCFATSQCNHTIRDAVCIDTNSNTILDPDSSKFKLEQWQQLDDLRQASKSALSPDLPKTKPSGISNFHKPKPVFFLDNLNRDDPLSFEAREDVIVSSYRNSPYEINYYTPELLKQNHTRRKTNDSSGERSAFDPTNPNNIPTDLNDTQSDGSRTFTSDESMTTQQKQATTNSVIQSVIPSDTTTTTAQSISSLSSTSTEPENGPTAAAFTTTTTTTVQSYYQESNTKSSVLLATSTTTLSSELSKKKLITKTANWPPGVCSCPLGHMFDSMLRKCLALSLADSHCQSDNDCKQIRSTHCSRESKKCECDEPLVWNQTELACQRPRPVGSKTAAADILATTTQQAGAGNGKAEGFFENLVPPLLVAKLLPDQTLLLLFFLLLVIICTLVLLKYIVKCCSSSNSALISPKNSKNRKSNNANNLLPPRSPYATLRKPEHKPNTQLSSFTQATRGRILNYDFEQDNPIPDTSKSPQSPHSTLRKDTVNEKPYGTLEKSSAGTLARLKGHKHSPGTGSNTLDCDVNLSTGTQMRKSPNVTAVDECLDLNDNVSLSGQLDSESKSESNSVLVIPGPPPTQAPPYMMASAMKGQGSAIAMAAAAVANRRMQMAQMRGTNENSTSNKLPNGKPVFL